MGVSGRSPSPPRDDTRVAAGVPQTVTYDLAIKTHTALFGLAYKFDWSRPAAAKY